MKYYSESPMHFFVLKLRRQGVRILPSAFLAPFMMLGFIATQAAQDDPKPTFNKDVAPIFLKNCIGCHSTKGIASRVPLVSYDVVRAWTQAIKEKVVTREMPPWPPDPIKSLKFSNDARLTQHDIDTIVAWINAGAPQGEGSDLGAAKPADGWKHPEGREPDLVVSLPGIVHLPATGEVPYVRLLVKVPFSEDRWVVASQTRPGNPAVVHHMAITEVALAEGVSASTVDQLGALSRQMGLPNALFGVRPAVTLPSDPEGFDMLGMYTPGATFEMYGGGAAKLVKGGSNMYFNFNIHYQTDGRPETDQSMLGLWFQPEPPRKQLFRVPGASQTIIVNGKELLTDSSGVKAEGTRVAIPPIPPYTNSHELIGVTGYTEAVTIYQLQPHAHHRGKNFQYTVVYPDGHEQTILSVPKYDHRWQMAYELETPLKLPAGSKLLVTAHYDNSMMNMHNPDPSKTVYFRDQNQSWDEMFSPFIQYTIDDQSLDTQAPMPQQDKTLKIAEAVGCLQQNASGSWILAHASDLVLSETQSTSSVDLQAAHGKALGNRRYELLGASVFAPASHVREKVAVKGVVFEVGHQSRLNVTSLQGVASACIGN